MNAAQKMCVYDRLQLEQNADSGGILSMNQKPPSISQPSSTFSIVILMNANPDHLSTDICDDQKSAPTIQIIQSHNDHPVHTDVLRHQHRRTIHTLASDRQVLNDPTIVTRIPTDHRVRNITSADQAHPDITRTTMADPPAHQDITPKAHRILNGTQHKTSGNPTGNLHSLTAAILMVGESHPIVQ